MLTLLKKIIPKSLFDALAPTYHWLLARTGSIITRFPSRELIVVGVTGTKGKSSTLEFMNAILEEAGFTTAIASTIRFKIGNESRPNLFKMTMPGRFFVQQFLREARTKGATHALVEMTSEGAKQYRHAFIDLDALIVTNIAPEHIESHGSFENYLAAKLSIGESLAHSSKSRRILVSNAEDQGLEPFRKITNVEQLPYSLAAATSVVVTPEKTELFLGETKITINIPGEFNAKNALAAITLAQAWGIDILPIKRGIEKLKTIPGRVEDVTKEIPSAPFRVIVDYAHTPDSLANLYGAFANIPKVCVLSGTGGGRDTWKRPTMGGIADQYCTEIILTDEDPYDEDPAKIVREIAVGITSKKPVIEMDRRVAIREALKRAPKGSVVLITGKGTDPYIMGPNGTKTPWSDAAVATEELKAHLATRN